MLQTVIDQLAEGYWIPKLPTIHGLLDQHALTRKEGDRLITAAIAEAKKNHKGRALNFTCLAFAWDQRLAMASARRYGVFRATNFDLNHRIPLYITTELAANRTLLGLKTDTITYLESCSALLQAAPHFHEAREHLRQALRRHPQTLLHGALAAVDFAYLTGDTRNTGLSPEDFAEGCSYLLALHTETIGATGDGLQPYDEAAAADGYYREILITSYRIRRYYQFEMRVDDHDYRANYTAEILTITPPSEEFEKALRFGYINVKQQIHRSQKGAADLKIVSYRDVAAYFLQKDLITYVPEPIPRIVMRFPIVREFLEHFEKHLFQEEVGLLDLEGRDLFVKPELLEREQVYQSLTIGDLLKVWRVVNFMVHTFAAYLEPLLTTNQPLCQRSLVPAFTDADLHAMIGEIIGPIKAAEYIKYLALGQHRNRDLVYQPLLKAGDVWYIPMNLIAGSNFIRNILQLSERRFHGSNDPLASLLAEDFRQIGVHAWPNVTFDYQGEEGDIDCLALVEDALFFFECKNALHPCGVFELRNTRQHLDKAAKQVARIDRVLKLPQFRMYLSNKVGHSLPTSGPHVGSIVLGHRIFSGYSVDGFEIRSIHELRHFITDGGATIVGQQIRVRPAGELNAAAMRSFIPERQFHNKLFEAMTPTQDTWTMRSLTVIDQTYHLDPMRLANAFGVKLVPPQFDHGTNPDQTPHGPSD